MTRNEALTKLKQKGHENVVEVSFPKNHVNHTHTHPFDAEIIVIEGDMKVIIGETEKHLNVGDGLSLTANVQHSECIGERGVTFMAGRPA